MGSRRRRLPPRFMIVDLTHNHGPARQRIIRRLFDEPSEYTAMDIEDAEREFGWTRAECMGAFLVMPRFAYCEVDGVPVFASGINDQGIFSSLSHRTMPDVSRTVAKHVRRWIKQPMGRLFMGGTVGYVWESDRERLGFMDGWMKILGYRWRRVVWHRGEQYHFYEWEPV